MSPKLLPATGRGRLLLLLALILWAASLAFAAWGWTWVLAREDGIRRRLGIDEKVRVSQTNLYAIRSAQVTVPREGRYGSIVALRDGVLHATRAGTLSFADKDRQVTTLSARVPIDIAAFESDSTAGRIVDADHFAVKDIALMPAEGGVRLVASYNAWDAAQDCYFLRVSSTFIRDGVALTDPAAFGPWSDHYDTTPCRKFGLLAGGNRRPTLAAGGRLAKLTDDEVLLTVGVFGTDSTFNLDPKSSYGKTVAIRLSAPGARIYTYGHRNPQGLVRTAAGDLILAEHGERGGDELNLLREGRDYGWPRVTYGTAYGMLEMPSNQAQGRHEGYEKPLYSWVPSIATSDLIEVQGDRFSHWKGDLLLTTLLAQSIYRVRIEDGVVRFAEPIPMGFRIRDITETSAGEVVLLGDNGPLIYITPLDDRVIDGSLLARERGQVIVAQCTACHTVDSDGATAIGPTLYGVYRRRIASVSGFQYSESLRAKGGRWTERNLIAFLTSPASFAPGTAMETPMPLDSARASDVVSYLRTLR